MPSIHPVQCPRVIAAALLALGIDGSWKAAPLRSPLQPRHPAPGLRPANRRHTIGNRAAQRALAPGISFGDGRTFRCLPS